MERSLLANRLHTRLNNMLLRVLHGMFNFGRLMLNVVCTS
jgi:hypothetical protein